MAEIRSRYSRPLTSMMRQPCARATSMPIGAEDVCATKRKKSSRRALIYKKTYARDQVSARQACNLVFDPSHQIGNPWPPAVPPAQRRGLHRSDRTDAADTRPADEL